MVNGIEIVNSDSHTKGKTYEYSGLKVSMIPSLSSLMFGNNQK